MPDWLRVLLGLEKTEIPQGGVARFELAGLPHGWWILVWLLILSAAVGLVVLIYRSESELSLPKRIVLSALRLLALAMVVLVLLNPRLAVEIQARRQAQTILLVDGSGSMGSADRYGRKDQAEILRATGLEPSTDSGDDSGGSPTRADLVARALERTRLARRLSEKNRVRTYIFEEEIAAADGDSLPNILRAAPKEGKATSIGSALRRALEAAAADPIAAVILISDGRSNGGEPASSARAELEARGVPLHALGVGRPDVRKNIALAELTAPEIAEAGLPLRIRARVRATGYPGTIEVKLTRTRLGTAEFEEVGSETVPLHVFDTEAVVNFTDAPLRDGRYRYVAEVAPLRGEESTRDNRRSAEVVVASEKCRVLLVAGSPTFEYRYLRNFFIRDPGIQVSAWLESADPDFPQEGDLPLRALPSDDDGLRPYDAIVLLDPDPGAFPAGFFAALERFVAELGGGLCFVAGEHYTAGLRSSDEGRRLLALLPVQLDGAGPGHDHRRPWRPELTEAGSAHAICQLAPSADENLKLWSILPKFYFRFPVQGIKPAASVLWQSGDAPVMAVHQAGAGRVLFIATDDLWRLRSYREEVHERLWSAAARYLAIGKRVAGTRKVAINTDRERYQLGDDVRIEAHILDADHKPQGGSQVGAVLELTEPPSDASAGGGGSGDPPSDGEKKEGGTEVQTNLRRELFLDAVPGRPGWFRGRMKAEALGRFRVSLTEAAEGVPAAFTVAPPSGESEDTSPDFAALEELARASGGSFRPFWEMDSVPPLVPDRAVVEVLGRKTATVWDSATLLLIFSGALIVEWILRKRWRLC